MDKYYEDITDIVIKNRDSKDNLIRRTVISLMSDLASYDSQTFVDNYLKNCMDYLLNQLKKDRDRSIGNYY